jgi:hypothetical protein
LTTQNKNQLKIDHLVTRAIIVKPLFHHFQIKTVIFGLNHPYFSPEQQNSNKNLHIFTSSLVEPSQKKHFKQVCSFGCQSSCLVSPFSLLLSCS